MLPYETKLPALVPSSGALLACFRARVLSRSGSRSRSPAQGQGWQKGRAQQDRNLALEAGCSLKLPPRASDCTQVSLGIFSTSPALLILERRFGYHRGVQGEIEDCWGLREVAVCVLALVDLGKRRIAKAQKGRSDLRTRKP